MFIAITQRVEQLTFPQERRDALDQRWISLLQELGLTVVVLPNNICNAMTLLKNIPLQGIILSGGNSLVEYQGDSPERDQLEKKLLSYAKQNNLPLLGVCRGMQLIQHLENIKLHSVSGHVSQSMEIIFQGQKKIVNSYHNWGAFDTSSDLRVLAIANDGVIKAIEHKKYPIYGIMWHPERTSPFAKEDLEFLKGFL